MAAPESSPLPPTKVEETSAFPAGVSFATKASPPPPPKVRCAAPTVVGNPADAVEPVTYALPAPSTAMPLPSSMSAPPR